MELNKARRYNSGKLRYSLVPAFALSKVVEVYTKGAEKYTIRDEEGNIIDDGANNWRKGFDWMGMMDSVQRHIESWKQGEDIDPDLQTLHLANAAWGLLSLIEFTQIYPEGDDRVYIKEKVEDQKKSFCLSEVLGKAKSKIVKESYHLKNDSRIEEPVIKYRKPEDRL